MNGRARLLVTALAMAATGFGLMLADAKPSTYSELRAMPVASRRALADNLRRFNDLPAEERRQLVALDRFLADASTEDRRRYESVLHRYQLWRNTLPTDRRATLDATSPGDRLELIRSYREAETSEPDQTADLAFHQANVLTPYSLFESSFLLRTWFRLTPNERMDVDAIKAPDQRTARIEALAAERQITRDWLPLREEFDALRRQAAAEGIAKAADLPTAKALRTWRPQGKAIVLLRAAESRHLARHEPKPVDAETLLRFDRALPAWFRESMTSLPPDVARPRLTFLLRQVFPDGNLPPEMDSDGAAASPPSKGVAP